jgi:hypothetical protein
MSGKKFAAQPTSRIPCLKFGPPEREAQAPEAWHDPHDYQMPFYLSAAGPETPGMSDFPVCNWFEAAMLNPSFAFSP